MKIDKTIIYSITIFFVISFMLILLLQHMNRSINTIDYKYSICFGDRCLETNNYKIIKNNCISFYDEVHKHKIITCEKYTITNMKE